jgi:hypothetical protein
MLNGMIYVAWQDASSNFQVIYFDSNVSTVKSASPPAGGPGCSKPSIAFNTVNAKDVLWLTWLENQEFMMSQSTDGVNFGTPTNLGIQGKNSELALVPGPDGTYLAWADQNNNIYWKNPAGQVTAAGGSTILKPALLAGESLILAYTGMDGSGHLNIQVLHQFPGAKKREVKY